MQCDRRRHVPTPHRPNPTSCEVRSCSIANDSFGSNRMLFRWVRIQDLGTSRNSWSPLKPARGSRGARCLENHLYAASCWANDTRGSIRLADNAAGAGPTTESATQQNVQTPGIHDVPLAKTGNGFKTNAPRRPSRLPRNLRVVSICRHVARHVKYSRRRCAVTMGPSTRAAQTTAAARAGAMRSLRPSGASVAGRAIDAPCDHAIADREH